MLFTFPSRYLFTIGLSEVFSLARWSWLFQAGFLVPRRTQGTAGIYRKYVYRAFTSYGRPFQGRSTSHGIFVSQPYNPAIAETTAVWAIPVSLATTTGITFVFFSSGYLDVSVPRVRLPTSRDIPINRDGLPHSGTCGSIRICRSPQFIAACHALHRL